ncbi:MAG: hypothetical protein Q8Q08_08395 [Candidatus Omnitrophota bacterium]|nr:hypothetical protein [Candidatus Omnitrophota bacterium]
MSFEDFMAKIRYWDNLFARWMMRHFYMLFFEFVLVVIFFWFIFTTFRAIDIASTVSRDNVIEQLMLTQTTSTLIIVLLILLNSFWMLYIFNHINRVRAILKEISFYLTRRK